MNWWRELVAAVVMCLVGHSVSAQPPLSLPPPPAVETRLQSEVPAEVAWGAFLAAQYQIRTAVPAIVERLQSLPPDPDRNRRHHLLAALLDALIQLDARIPASVLSSYSREWPIHSLVLLGSATEGRDAALIRLLREATGDEWYAAANILLETKPAGFAAVILGDLHLTLTVTVSDLGNTGTISTGGGGAGVGDGIGELPPGFPPYAHYSFGGRRGATMLAPGPTPVHYRRIVHNTFQFPIFSHGSSGPADYDRVRYLAELQQVVSLDAITSVSVRWTDARTFKSEVRAAKSGLFERYERVIAALLRNERLTEAEARTLPARIELQVFDQRSDQSVPLPTVE